MLISAPTPADAAFRVGDPVSLTRAAGGHDEGAPAVVLERHASHAVVAVLDPDGLLLDVLRVRYDALTRRRAIPGFARRHTAS